MSYSQKRMCLIFRNNVLTDSSVLSLGRRHQNYTQRLCVCPLAQVTEHKADQQLSCQTDGAQSSVSDMSSSD